MKLPHVLQGCHSPSLASGQASELFFDDIFQNPILKSKVGDNALEPAQLGFHLLELFERVDLHATALTLPLAQSQLADAVLTRNVRNPLTFLVLSKYRNDLALGKS